MNKKIYIIIFFVLFMFAGFGSYVFYHENTHKAVFRNYGIDSEINYFNLKNFNIFQMTATTTPIGEYSCNGQCVSDQNTVDIEGYHMLALVLNMWIIFTLLLMVTWVRQ